MKKPTDIEIREAKDPSAILSILAVDEENEDETAADCLADLTKRELWELEALEAV